MDPSERLRTVPAARSARTRRDKQPAGVHLISDAGRAGILLHPLRMRILAALGQPDSAAGLARRLGLKRQVVNYHFQELRRANLLARAGRRKRRRFYDQCYVASAKGYLLSPELLGKLAADPQYIADTFSVNYLLVLLSKAQGELSLAARMAAHERKNLSSLSINSEIRFTSPAQRAQFTRELYRAVVDVVGRCSSPFKLDDGTSAPGRPYRLVLGCYPIPPAQPPKRAETRDLPERRKQ